MELDSKIVKQAVRDAASKDPGLSDQAVQYFASLDFRKLCKRNNIDGDAIFKIVSDLAEFPVLSRKKLANDIARVIDKEFTTRQ